VQVGPRLEGQGRAQLLVENLLDLTHIDYLHATSIDVGDLLDFPVRVRQERASFYATRATRTPWVPGFYDLIYGSQNRFDGLHEALGESWYFSPAYLRTGITISSIENRAVVDRALYGNFYFHHFVTPQNAHSVHYFVGLSRNYRLEDEELSRAMLSVDIEVRNQDIEAIAAIEQNLGACGNLNPELLVKSDMPAIQVRRHIQRQLDEEAAARADQPQRA
jgi:phenylpropionate dioxygenase-like ring-hydroxylating dioxygenase large terminal subunit